MNHQYEVIIIGGGVTGASVGYGIAKRNIKTAMLDAVPVVERASRSNMGLIWVQSKALGNRDYVEWGFQSSALYPEFAREVNEAANMDMMYAMTGGIIPCLGEADLKRRADYVQNLKMEAKDVPYPVEMITRKQMEEFLPKVQFGEEVIGGTWCPHDAYVDPLHLLYALRRAFVQVGGDLKSDCRVYRIEPLAEGYRVHTNQGCFECMRLVLAGGLGNRQLAAHFDLKVPITPNRAQALLLERIPDILPIPLLGIARARGGTVMIGAVHEEVGTDMGLSPERLGQEAVWAKRVWPALAKLRVLRFWSCLRIFPWDGYPIYDTIPGYKNAFILNLHSSVTLAAVQEKMLPDFILGNSGSEMLAPYRLSRFNAAREG